MLICAQLAEAQGRRDGLLAEARILHEDGPYAVRSEPSISRTELLRLKAREPEIRAGLANAQADVEELSAVLRDAEGAERERRAAELRKRKAPLVLKLSRALGEAAAISAELAAIEEEEGWSAGATRLAWPELAPETPLAASRLATWTRFAQMEGFNT